MNLPRLNPYYRASLVLIGAAVILITLAIVTNQRDITTAAVVLSALVCLVTGVFLATLSSGEPLDVRYVSLLPVQGSINLARLGADLGRPSRAASGVQDVGKCCHAPCRKGRPDPYRAVQPGLGL